MSETAPAKPYTKPLPEPTAATRPFWEGARNHKLMLQRSAKTGKYLFYPRAVSPFATDDTLEWVEASGRGTVYSYTIARRPTAPQWAEDGPYAIAIIALEEGPHMTANVVECDVESVKIGMPVVATYVQANDEITLVQFKPAPAA